MKTSKAKQQKRQHYCLLVNSNASNYNDQIVKNLITSIKKRGSSYTLLEPTTAIELYDQAMSAAGLKRHRGAVTSNLNRWGNITSLIACGGDGTFNLVARAGLKSGLPVGAIPMGKYNNIARSIYGSVNIEDISKIIFNQKIRKIDAGQVVNQIFFGSVGVGFLPNLFKLLETKKTPRFKLGWSKMGSIAAKISMPTKTVIKVDSFRFEISPTLLNINLLPYSVGLPMSITSIIDDNRAEIIFDAEVNPKVLGSFTADIAKGSYYFNEKIRMFRGKSICIEPFKKYELYLDGELVTLPTDLVEITVLDKQLNVYA